VRTAQFAAVGVTSLLEAVRVNDRNACVYQASSSEIFGEPLEVPQTESTRLAPVTPYGVAKAYAHFIVRTYRRRYGVFACCGILYNHESPRRSLSFLPRKVANGAASIRLGLASELVLGDLHATRDWGFAGDYVQAMWLMLQAPKPDDYVIATGELHSVQDLVEIAFEHVDLDWRHYVKSSGALRRGAAELHNLVGDARKARSKLGWHPTVSFEEMVCYLVDAELQRLSSGVEHKGQFEHKATAR
jgi:GDPmannose 4,6-dehydratase